MRGACSLAPGFSWCPSCTLWMKSFAFFALFFLCALRDFAVKFFSSGLGPGRLSFVTPRRASASHLACLWRRYDMDTTWIRLGYGVGGAELGCSTRVCCLSPVNRPAPGRFCPDFLLPILPPFRGPPPLRSAAHDTQICTNSPYFVGIMFPSKAAIGTGGCLLSRRFALLIS